MAISFLKKSARRAETPGSALAAQERIVPEEASLSSENGLGGGRGQLAVEVGRRERAKADSRPGPTGETRSGRGPVADAASDGGRVFERGWEEGPGGLEGGMTGLHHLLGVAQVAPDKDVDVRPVGHLLELHGG